MDRSCASQLQAFFKATLLGLAILSMITWVPHVYSCLRNFFLVSLPSAASAVITPKCLFVFSNIIVIFLANESKLSESGTPYSMSSEDNIDVAKHQPAALTPVIKEKDGDHAAEEMIKEEQEDMVVAHESLQQLDQCDQLLDASSTSIVGVGVLREDRDISVEDFGDGEGMEVEERLEQGRVELREEVIEDEECEEEMVLPADELNRRVEDFIARFKMERQFEARMLV